MAHRSMNPRFQKILLATAKVAILVAIVEYARRQSQADDEIAVPEAHGAAFAELASRGEVTGAGTNPQVRLPTVDGRTIDLAPGARLRVVAPPDPRQTPRPSYRAETQRGDRVDIPAADVEGAGVPTDAVHIAPFSLLPGVRSLLRNLDLGYLGLAFLLFGPALLLMAVRWRVLLLASGIVIPFFTLLRLHYMGFFFNSFMPGGAGGDIIKAVYVARHCSKKAEAATMVLVDRVIGLIGLLIMAGGVVLIDYRHLGGIALQVSILSLTLTVGGVLFFSAKFRTMIRYDWLLSRLPRAEVIKRVDAALYALGQQKKSLALALGLTVFLQLLEVIGVYFAGHAIGIHRARFTNYLAFVPIGYLANAVPISFGGIGLMEGAYLKLFRDAGVATATQGFMLGVVTRLVVITWSLLGAPAAIFPPKGANDLAPHAAPAHAGAPK